MERLLEGHSSALASWIYITLNPKTSRKEETQQPTIELDEPEKDEFDDLFNDLDNIDIDVDEFDDLLDEF